MKTAELTGAALDWAVAKCEGDSIEILANGMLKIIWSYNPANFRHSSNWARGGPIIEREKISLIRCDDDFETDSKGFTTTKRITVWAAEHGGGHSSHETYGSQGDFNGDDFQISENACSYGPTPLIAAMRCYVASKLGDEIEIPEELLGA